MTLDLNNLDNFGSEKMMRFSRSWSLVSPFHMGELNQKQGFFASNVSANTVNSPNGYSKFQVTGMVEWGKKKKKSLGLPAIPKKIPG